MICNHKCAYAERDFKKHGTVQKEERVRPSGGSLVSRRSAVLLGVTEAFMDTSCTALTATELDRLSLDEFHVLMKYIFLLFHVIT